MGVAPPSKVAHRAHVLLLAGVSLRIRLLAHIDRLSRTCSPRTFNPSPRLSLPRGAPRVPSHKTRRKRL